MILFLIWLFCCLMGWAFLRNPSIYHSQQPPTWKASFCWLLEQSCHTHCTTSSSYAEPSNFLVSVGYRRKNLRVSSKGQEQSTLRAEPCWKTSRLVASTLLKDVLHTNRNLGIDSLFQWYTLEMCNPYGVLRSWNTLQAAASYRHLFLL